MKKHQGFRSLSFFYQLTACFIFIIAVMCLFYFALSYYYTREYAAQKQRQEAERFYADCQSMDQLIENIYKNFLKLMQNKELASSLNREGTDGYTIYTTVRQLAGMDKDESNNPYYFICPDADDGAYVLGADASYKKDLFLKTLLSNASDPERFCSILRDHTVKRRLLPADTFSLLPPMETAVYLPVVCRIPSMHFAFIALIRPDAYVDIASGDELAIYVDDGTLLYASDICMTQWTPEKAISGNSLATNGFIFYNASATTGLTYVKYASFSLETKDSIQIYRMFALLLLAAVMICIIFTILIARWISKPLAAISAKFDRTRELPSNFNTLSSYVDAFIQASMTNELKLADMSTMMSEMTYRAQMMNLMTLTPRSSDNFDPKAACFAVLIRLHGADDLYIKTFQADLETRLQTDAIPYALVWARESDLMLAVNREPGAAKRETQTISLLMSLADQCLFTAVVSRDQNALPIGEAYARLSPLVLNRRLDNKSQIYYEDDTFNVHKYIRFTVAQQEKLINLMLSGQAEALAEAVREILAAGAAAEITNNSFNMLCIEIIGTLLRALEKENDMESKLDINALPGRIIGCATLPEYLRVFDDIVSEIVGARNMSADAERVRYKNIIGYVKEYIEEHYHEDLSLDMVASELHITSAYLSHYFKSATGIGFVEYLNSRRTEKAKLLLERGNLTVNEIGRRCGYNNTAAFIRNFKRFAGITPKEYEWWFYTQGKSLERFVFTIQKTTDGETSDNGVMTRV